MSLKSSNKTDVNMWELEFEVDPDKFDEAVNAVYKRQKKNITVPGFRKGHATRKMVEMRYGEGIFWEDAANDLINPEVADAVKELNLTLVDTPKIEVQEIGGDNGFKFTAACVVKPEIKVEDYKGIHAPKKVKEVTDKDIDEQIESLRQRNARIVSADDREAKDGDNANINFKGFVDGEAFDGGEAENYDLKLGSGQFIPGFEDQIIGKKVGDEFDVNVKFPEDYGVDTLSGKDAVFKVKLNSLSYEELPELDDDFVKDATEFDTVDQLREDTKKKLEDNANSEADRDFQNAIMDALIAKVTDPIPRVMFEHRVDDLIRQFESSLRQQGLTLDIYLQYTGMNMDKLRESYETRAENEVKLRLALEAIANEENLEVSDDEVKEGLKTIADDAKLTVERVMEILPMDDYKEDLRVDKAMDLVKNSAVVDNDIPEKSEDDSDKDDSTKKED